MTALPFGATYAQAYDALYADKDYAKECDLLCGLLGKVSSVLDLGCGTGSHARELARRGISITGVDRSEQMIAQARQKTAGLPVQLVCADLKDFQIEGSFDAAIMMFAVLGYLTDPADTHAALTRVRAHLSPGALFAFDVWFGPAVLRERPEPRTKKVATGEQNGWTREATPRIDVLKQTVDVHYRLTRSDGTRAEETHSMRFFFPLELELMLEKAGFALTSLRSFPDGAVVTESTWNVLVVARAA